MQAGCEGGTWFGVSSKFAKIGALLNISQPTVDIRKHGRGHLVTNYLQTELDALSYINTVAERQQDFNPFNLVLLEQRFGLNMHYTDSHLTDCSNASLMSGCTIVQ